MLTQESAQFDKSKRIIIVTGTDPTVPKGGIGQAITGHLAALCLPYEFIPTYHQHNWSGKWWPIFRAIPTLIQSVKQAKKNGFTPVVFSHIGKDGSVLREMIILLIARLCGAKTFAQLHSVVEEYFKSNLSAWLFKLLLFQSDQVGVLTRYWKEELVKRGVEKKIVVLPNPLSEDLAQRAKSVLFQNKNKQCETSVFTMTRIEPGKGVELIIEAMQYLPKQISLIVAGDGSGLSACKRKAQLLKVDDRIKFAGWVERKKKQQLFQQADIFCLPTTYDSFGMVFIEAMANGLPVIAL
ncbi:MAG: glycosyltransferase, partial [Candidatus Electrothrix sp. AR1]|nr:glycosyltransferase [Candidatus Electrothrix sp. AR1]